MMRLCLLACSLLAPSMLHGETNIWTRIEKLSKNDSPRGNPQLTDYLKSLTREQMLEAARECCGKAKSRVPEDRWEEGVIPVALVLTYYRGADGRIADTDLERLLGCIASRKEELLFRESLVRVLRHAFWRELTAEQRRGSWRRFLAVVNDSDSPVQLRVLACRELELAVAEEHRSMILRDANVMPLRRDKEKWGKLDALIRSGEIQLEPRTRDSLKALGDEAKSIVPVLTALVSGVDCSPQLRVSVQRALTHLSGLEGVGDR